MSDKDQNAIIVVEAVLPEELILSASDKGQCNGDGCHDDQGGHGPADADCGQDC